MNEDIVKAREVLHNLKRHDFESCGNYKLEKREAAKVTDILEKFIVNLGGELFKDVDPCPKCKSTNIKVTDDIEYMHGGYYCKCESCGYYLKGHYNSKERAIQVWNSREEEK